MRNLKRTLCLVMTTVMMLSLMVFNAGAVSYDDLSDKDQIVNDEAVSTMVSLNIINGKDNGSFDPKANVTRAEMAKMITVALHGGVDPVLATGASSFTDTKGHWAERYIEYCAANGIISGRGDGRFDPNANVTGTEAAKMILVALGYKSDVFYFTGADWAMNVNTRANDVKAKLYDNLGYMNASAAITRDEAAQMLYNGTIKAEMLTMTPMQTVTTGEVTYQYNWGGSMLNERFDADIYEGVIEANEYASVGTGTTTKEGQYSFKVQLKNDKTTGIPSSNLIIAGNTTPDMLGKCYKVIVKDTVKGGVHTVAYGEPVLSTRNNIYTVSADKTNDTVNKFSDAIRSAGVNPATISSATVYLNLATTGAPTIAGASALKTETGNGYIIEVIDNDADSNAELILITKPHIGEVTAYNEKGNSGDGSISVASKGSNAATSGAGTAITAEKFENVVGVEDLAKDDIVSWIKLPDGKFYVTKLNTVTGEVDRQTGNNEVRLDGVTYKQSALGDYFKSSNERNLVAAAPLGKEATLYLDASGYVVYVSAPKADAQYLFVTALEGQGSITGAYAKVVFADGTTATVKVTSFTASSGTEYKGATLVDSSKANGIADGASSAGLTVDKVYKYTVSGDDYKLTLENVTAEQNATGKTITKGNAGLIGTTATADGKTTFVVKSGDNWTVYNGIANVPSMSGVSASLVRKSATNNAAEVVFVYAGANTGASKSIYILDSKLTAMKNSKDETVYVAKALVDGVYTNELIIKDAPNGTSTLTRGLYNGEGITVSDNKVAWSIVNNTTDGADETYTNPALVTVKPDNDVITGLIAGSGNANADIQTKSDETLIVTKDTQFILINGSKESDVTLDATIGDIVVGESAVVMTRASYNKTDAGYYQAAVVYIIP